jgi:hypothetical protein
MAFGIAPEAILNAGTIDVALNCDANLFIDPTLLPSAADRVFSECATRLYQERFSNIARLLEQSNQVDDFAWRNAERLFEFPEFPYSHLGYASGRRGAGSGQKIRSSLMANCREAIRLGVTSPDLFLVLALFEENIGADRISDMVAKIVAPCLAEFTERAAGRLTLPTRPFRVFGQDWRLPENPLAPDEPIILVPNDVVRDLPVAADWDSVAAAARETEDIRTRVSHQIGEIWAVRNRRDKEAVRATILSRREAFDQFLEIFRRAIGEPYNVRQDHLGEIYPAGLRMALAHDAPLDLTTYRGRRLSADEVEEVVCRIISQFQQLVENNGLWELLFDDDRVTSRREKAAQRLFFAVASAYCEANGLDLAPEADAGVGPVDFKVSDGSSKVIVELKKSTNSNLVGAYSAQVGAYVTAERPHASHYVVLDVGRFSAEKRQRLQEISSNNRVADQQTPRLWVIDATPKLSASNR